MSPTRKPAEIYEPMATTTTSVLTAIARRSARGVVGTAMNLIHSRTGAANSSVLLPIAQRATRRSASSSPPSSLRSRMGECLGAVAAEAQDLGRLVVPPHRLGHDQGPERKGGVHPYWADLGLHGAIVHPSQPCGIVAPMNEREQIMLGCIVVFTPEGRPRRTSTQSQGQPPMAM